MNRCKNRQHLRDFIFESTKQLVDTNEFKYKMKTRIFWILNDIDNWNDNRAKCIVCGKPLKNINVKNVYVGYVRKTCCKACERKLAQQNIKNAMQSKYGVDNAYQIPTVVSELKERQTEIQNHRNATKRKNHTFKTSKKEDLICELLYKHFSKDDVIRQYSSNKYPFNCDFYIKSLDLYIECNFSWTHGGHFFDESQKEDQEKLKLWKSKNTKYYDNAIKTWTVRDVAKRRYAIENKLSYVVFWTFEEAKERITKNDIFKYRT